MNPLYLSELAVTPHHIRSYSWYNSYCCMFRTRRRWIWRWRRWIWRWRPWRRWLLNITGHQTELITYLIYMTVYHNKFKLYMSVFCKAGSL